MTFWSFSCRIQVPILFEIKIREKTKSALIILNISSNLKKLRKITTFNTCGIYSTNFSICGILYYKKKR